MLQQRLSDRQFHSLGWLLIAVTTLIAVLGAKSHAGGWNDGSRLASVEMLPRATLARMARQVFACERPTRLALEQFSEWTDERLWLFDHFGRATPSSVIAVTRYFADHLHGHHVVIDSMMMVVGSEEGMDEQKQFMTDLVRVAQETGLHLHLVAHCRKPASGDENKPPAK